MKLYKAHFLHPYTNVPLIVYFNENSGLLAFEKDEEVIKVMTMFESNIKDKAAFMANLEKSSHLCQTSYPVTSLEDVYEFLEQMGVEKEDIKFKPVLLH
jgi:hypothetical protein